MNAPDLHSGSTSRLLFNELLRQPDGRAVCTGSRSLRPRHACKHAGATDAGRAKPCRGRGGIRQVNMLSCAVLAYQLYKASLHMVAYQLPSHGDTYAQGSRASLFTTQAILDMHATYLAAFNGARSAQNSVLRYQVSDGGFASAVSGGGRGFPGRRHDRAGSHRRPAQGVQLVLIITS